MDEISPSAVRTVGVDRSRKHSGARPRRTAMKRGSIGIATLCCTVVMSTGCTQVVQGHATAAAGQISGSPSTSRPSVPAGQNLDPCTLPLKSLDPDGTLGLRETNSPSTPGRFGICIWLSSDYSLSVDVTVSDYVSYPDPGSNPNVEDFRSEKVGAFTFDVFRAVSTIGDDGKSESCNAQTETSAGNVSVGVIEIDLERSRSLDACSTVEQIVRSLEPYLPAPK